MYLLSIDYEDKSKWKKMYYQSVNIEQKNIFVNKF